MSERLKPGYTGHLRKVDGEVVGELCDAWGWVIRLTAKPHPEGGYELTGILGEAPPDLWIPILDEEKA